MPLHWVGRSPLITGEAGCRDRAHPSRSSRAVWGETSVGVREVPDQVLSSGLSQDVGPEGTDDKLKCAVNSDSASAADIARYLVVDVCGSRMGLRPGEHRSLSGVSFKVAESVHVPPE